MNEASGEPTVNPVGMAKDWTGCQRLMTAVPGILRIENTSEQLESIRQLFNEVWPQWQLVWCWRGKFLSPEPREVRPVRKVTCSNILSGYLYSLIEKPQSERLHAISCWVSSAAEIVIAANRSRVSRADFAALAELREHMGECAYIKAANQYVELFTPLGRNHLFRLNLHQVESLFSPDPLVRVHRSYMVNPVHVRGLHKKRNGRLRLKLGQTEIPVGECYGDRLRAAFPHWFESVEREPQGAQWLRRIQCDGETEDS
ncbi:LytTR family DNA-binding domain-containing protein [Ferrimonas gelatinilytica]